MTSIIITNKRQRKYRGRHEMLAEMLRQIDVEGVKYKTHLMFVCNLSWDQLKMYLNGLIAAGFVRSEIESGTGHKLYQVTKAGKEWYKAVKETEELIALDACMQWHADREKEKKKEKAKEK